MTPRPTGTPRPPTIDELFRKDGYGKQKPIKKRYFAVRQLNGPKKHADKVFFAFDRPDAARQFFCYHGLTGKTYRYRLIATEVPSDHPLAKDAIECNTPRSIDELTMDKLQDDAFEDQQQILASGEAARA